MSEEERDTLNSLIMAENLARYFIKKHDKDSEFTTAKYYLRHISATIERLEAAKSKD
jgi:hypothetical protein